MTCMAIPVLLAVLKLCYILWLRGTIQQQTYTMYTIVLQLSSAVNVAAVQCTSTNTRVIVRSSLFVFPSVKYYIIEMAVGVYWINSSLIRYCVISNDCINQSCSMSTKINGRSLVYSCDQAALWMVQSARLSVRLSHLFHYVSIIVSSWNFQELLPMTEVKSMQNVKVKGQSHRGQNPT